MKIASDYGKRLGLKSQNLKPDTLGLLTETYSSHSFVIDQTEAASLFTRVRSVNEHEAAIVSLLGELARFQITRQSEFVCTALSARAPTPGETNDHAAANSGRNPADDVSDSARSGRTPVPIAEAKHRQSGDKPSISTRRVKRRSEEET
jgi:hypothetical protein